MTSVKNPARPAQIRLLISICLPVLLAVVISGCGDQAGAPSGAAPPAAAVPVHVTATLPASSRIPDPPEGAETTAYAPDVTPQFLLDIKDNTKAKTIARYQFAVAHKDALAQVPCYCGCALYMHPHTSLESCYIRQVQADGKIVYTDHSTSCDICSGEVTMMMAQFANTPLKALRDAIHAKYSYTSVWTDTPPIQ